MLSDADGLSRAYKLHEGVCTQGDAMYIAGTKSFHDAWDDLKIPFGQTASTERFRNASLVLDAMPQVRRIVGHSLGGAVALQLEKHRYSFNNLRCASCVSHGG